MQKRPRNLSIPSMLSVANSFNNEGKLDCQLFKLWVSCGFFNKIDLWKTMHWQTKCCKLSRSMDRNNPYPRRVIYRVRFLENSSWLSVTKVTRRVRPCSNGLCCIVCIYVDVPFVTYTSLMMVPTCRVYTPPSYATIPILICRHVVSVLLNIRWWCVSTCPNSGTIPTHCTRGLGLCLFF